MKKCLTCPYRLGLIQCKRDPCPRCKVSGRKTHPFPLGGAIRNRKQVRKAKADVQKAFGVDENDRIMLSYAFWLRRWITIVPHCDRGCDALQTLRNAVLETILNERRDYMSYIKTIDRLFAEVSEYNADPNKAQVLKIWHGKHY